MAEYGVKLTSRALRDLDGIYGYIARTLLEPGTALALAGRIEAAILSLDTMPPLPGAEAGRLCGPGIPAAPRGKLHGDLPD